jgi:hypothetical protein
MVFKVFPTPIVFRNNGVSFSNMRGENIQVPTDFIHTA